MTAFRPRMTSDRRGITTLGEPLSHVSDSGLVEIWRARCEPGASGDYVSRDPRLFVLIERPSAEIALDGGPAAGRVASRELSASFVPAGAPLRLSVAGATEVRHLDLHFDPERLGPVDGLDAQSVATPRLMFADRRVQRFARLLEGACAERPGALGLYGDGLAAALVAAAFAPRQESATRSPLSDRRLRLAIDYIEARCAETIRLRELAGLADLSETYFSHAFKAATGMPPHRWQLQARVRKAKAMIATGGQPLSEIAGALGFSDQPHFNRVFREFAGVAPSAWRTESQSRRSFGRQGR